MTCPLCGSEADKVIYAGIPAKLCRNDNCTCLWGFWIILIALLPFNGWFFVYEGSYLRGLYEFMRHRNENEP